MFAFNIISTRSNIIIACSKTQSSKVSSGVIASGAVKSRADSSLDCYVRPRILHDRPQTGKHKRDGEGENSERGRQKGKGRRRHGSV